MNYDSLASQSALDKTVSALKAHNIDSLIVETAAAALEKIKELIPAGVSVMNGSSRTLEQIGFIDYLKSNQHHWNNLHAAIVAEKDPIQQAALRQKALNSDYYLGSIHAVTETGEFLVASNTGSQLPHIVFTSKHLIFVVGTQKIVSDLGQAMKRLEEYILPLENENMKQKYGISSHISKVLLFKFENPNLGRQVKIIFVKEKLGF